MVNVTKASGEKEQFDEEKLRLSIRRANIPEMLHDQVVNHIKNKLYEGIPTSEIYKHVIEFLDNSSHPNSKTKYSLKQAIMDFGPTGFPFEDFISEILKAEGYETQVRQILQGKCISHEIDIVGSRDNIKSMIECKFHNGSGIKCHVHVSLYTKARFDDVKEGNNFNDAWLVTNTKLTTEALSFALCSNIKIISWDYPNGKSLRDLIEKHKLHPITTLSNISTKEKQLLTQNHIVLAKDICKNPSSLDILHLPPNQKNLIVSQCQFISG